MYILYTYNEHETQICKFYVISLIEDSFWTFLEDINSSPVEKDDPDLLQETKL